MPGMSGLQNVNFVLPTF